MQSDVGWQMRRAQSEFGSQRRDSRDRPALRRIGRLLCWTAVDLVHEGLDVAGGCDGEVDDGAVAVLHLLGVQRRRLVDCLVIAGY